ncbi:hypothetical protein O9929_11470 [Vibrio lentus]|nr:hypothetical protein [Vibrio lentus]
MGRQRQLFGYCVKETTGTQTQNRIAGTVLFIGGNVLMQDDYLMIVPEHITFSRSTSRCRFRCRLRQKCIPMADVASKTTTTLLINGLERSPSKLGYYNL